MPPDNDAVAPTPDPLLMEEIPQTLTQLNDRIGKLFHCVMGPPQAYFEIPLSSRPRDESGELAVERVVYTSLVWRTGGPTPAVMEERLVMSMLEPFLDARRQIVGDQRGTQAAKPILFWRRPITLEAYRNRGESVDRMKIYCRVAIPGADLRLWERTEGGIIPLSL